MIPSPQSANLHSTAFLLSHPEPRSALLVLPDAQGSSGTLVKSSRRIETLRRAPRPPRGFAGPRASLGTARAQHRARSPVLRGAPATALREVPEAR